MEKLEKFIKKLGEQNIVSKKPAPIYIFLLFFIFLFLWIISLNLSMDMANMLLSLTIFTFIFAIVHWYIVRTLSRKKFHFQLKKN